MTQSTTIAAANRRRTEEDRPFFNKRINDLTESQKAFAIQLFEKSLDEMKKELACVLAEREHS